MYAVSCQLTHAEMREAFRMNLDAKFWTKAVLGNLRPVLYLAIIVGLVATRLAKGGEVKWEPIGVLAGLMVFFIALYFWRLNNSIKKSAKAVNDACSQMIVDGQGITAEGTNGTKTFVPWTAFKRWKEGKLVFTVGDGKTFRTFSKSGLGEMQTGELRSLLMSSIR